MKDLFERLLVLRSPGIGPAKYNELLKKFGEIGAVVDVLNPSQTLRDAVMREIDRAHNLKEHWY